MIGRAERQLQGVQPDVLRPRGNPLLQPGTIISKKRADRLFIAGQITSHRLHEPIGGLLGDAALLPRSSVPPGFLHQSSQNGGRTPGLGGQPFPMSR